MAISAIIQKNILQVTREDVDYFKRFKPLHYVALQEMIRHGEAVIVEDFSGAWIKNEKNDVWHPYYWLRI